MLSQIRFLLVKTGMGLKKNLGGKILSCLGTGHTQNQRKRCSFAAPKRPLSSIWFAIPAAVYRSAQGLGWKVPPRVFFECFWAPGSERPKDCFFECHLQLFERCILWVGEGTPVTWIKVHTSEAQRRTLGMDEADFLGNGRADAAAKAALLGPSPLIEQWEMWRKHAEKFWLFWGTFGPTLATRDQKQAPQQPREETPLVYGPEAPKAIGEHPRVVVGTDLPHIQCLSCGLRAAHANGYPRWAFLKHRGCWNSLGEDAAPAAPNRNYAGGMAPVRILGVCPAVTPIFGL